VDRPPPAPERGLIPSRLGSRTISTSRTLNLESVPVIRVIYRWRVDGSRATDFATWWHEGTLRIRSTQPGAMGSTLLRAEDDGDRLIGIARWQSKDQLESFWERMSPLEFNGAVLESLEVLEEVDHLTVEGEG
jgi:hypothetical protein